MKSFSVLGIIRFVSGELPTKKRKKGFVSGDPINFEIQARIHPLSGKSEEKHVYIKQRTRA